MATLTHGLRELRDGDAEQVAALFRTTFGEARALDAEEIRTWIRNEELKPEWLQVLEVDGRVVGYGDVVIEDDEVALDVAAPGHWDPFLDWAEETAKSRGIHRVRAFIPAGHELADVVAARSYKMWRSSFTMERDLKGSDPPAMPDGFRLRSYRPDLDAEVLRSALNEAFADDPTSHEESESGFRESFLKARGFDPSLWLLAWAEDELAGFAIAFPERSGNNELAWIRVLGVRSPWRRRGLGEALLQAAFFELQRRGIPRVGLGVDVENVTGALRLYERVGMSPTTRWDNWILDPIG
jgi:mycothiol synthase